ncbi:ChaN family lipoprotein [Flavobacterium agricola]|uniref:ChaN family lipoprotein n=1 Tax=Flavobacterium agricola TaxID=2870839 RepID=A0ABY6LXG1_9FLAO|nr:ChaN family lipoprotein [Flavobacterium agricola]UYW00856.1 ChaN family lipoprotein [Flavobacterium agricola]
MTKNIYIILAFFISISLHAQKLEPFVIFNQSGKKISDKKFLKSLADADVVLFGELHDNSTAHWLQLKVIQTLHQKHKVVVGMEMFETDNQAVLNQYLSNQISAKQLDTLARLWNNYKTDYKPIVDFSKENSIPVIATNIPRRYASLLFKQGEEALLALPETDKQWFPALPMPYDENLSAYKAMLAMFDDPVHANKNFPKAQAIKDYTMAHNILKFWKQNLVFIHLHGSYHSNNFEGIYWYLKQTDPNLKVVTIATVMQSDLNKLAAENNNLADYVIVTDFDTVRTF